MSSIKSKIRLANALLSLMGVATITILSAFLFYQSALTQTKDNITQLTNAYTLAVEHKMEVFKQQLESIATESDITSRMFSVERRIDMLNEYTSNTEYLHLGVSDASGLTYENTNISDQLFFQKAMEGETYISSPVESTTAPSGLSVFVGTPINNKGVMQGVVYGELDYDVFHQIVSEARVGDGGYGFVVDQSGHTIAHPEINNVRNPSNYFELAKTDKAYETVAALYEKMTAGEEGVTFTVYKGTKRMAAYHPISGPEKWAIAVSVPLSQIMHGIYRTIAICAAASIVLIILTSIIGAFMADGLARRITISTERLEKLAKGDLTSEVVVFNEKDETFRLSDALHRTVTNLSEYVVDISLVLSAMASKDFSAPSQVDYEGDFMPIKTALDTILDALNQTFAGIKQATLQVRDGAAQVSYGAQSLSQSSTQQASSVELLTDAIEALSTKIHQNAQAARDAAEMAEHSESELNNGKQQMNAMMKAMREIEHDSGEISKVIKAIDDIAFQINILSLNAAVEAARAGAAGKGFAVVADEVRNLAAKSAQAAKETSELIGHSITSVNQGTTIAAQTVSSLNAIVDRFHEMNVSIEKISAATEEQNQSVSQITDSMLQISAATQANSATAQQSAAASQEMSSQAELLKELTDGFVLNVQPVDLETNALAMPEQEIFN